MMRLVAIFVFLAALVLLGWMAWGGSWGARFTLDGSIAWLEAAGSWAWAAGFLLLIGDVALPVPGTIVISALGYIYGVVIGGLIAAAGLIAAGLLGYGLCRVLGVGFAQRWLGAHDLERARRLFLTGGGWAVALSRALPIFPEVISCTAGLVGMPFRRFVVALACGSLPMGFIFAAVGSAGREAPAWALALSLGIPALLWWLAARVQKANIDS